jgi:hypothetical protein
LNAQRPMTAGKPRTLNVERRTPKSKHLTLNLEP